MMQKKAVFENIGAYYDYIPFFRVVIAGEGRPDKGPSTYQESLCYSPHTRRRNPPLFRMQRHGHMVVVQMPVPKSAIR